MSTNDQYVYTIVHHHTHVKTGATRIVQGRLNDVSMFLAANAKLDEQTGAMTEESAKALSDIARKSRLVHHIHWCSVVKRFGCLLTPEGFSYLYSKKIVSHDEYEALVQVSDNGISATAAAMTWYVSRISTAVKRGEIDADQATMTAAYNKITELRGYMWEMNGKLRYFGHTLHFLFDRNMHCLYLPFVTGLEIQCK